MIDETSSKKCLKLQTEFVEHCKQYTISESSAYQCKICTSGYEIKNTPTSRICLSGLLIDSHCDEYSKNANGIYECSKCSETY